MKKIIAIISSVLALGLLLFTLTKRTSQEDTICSDTVVLIESDNPQHFTNEKEIISLLQKKGLNATNKPIESIKLDKIRKTIEQIPHIREARCYITKDNQLGIQIIERKPIYRFIGDPSNYFVDSQRVIVKSSDIISAYLPIVNGNINDNFAKNELFDLIYFIEEDNFLSKFIQQIYVNKNQEVILIPIINNTEIIVGNISKSENDTYDFDKKISRLKKLLASDAFNKLGWDRFSTIDLRFDKQIVCK